MLLREKEELLSIASIRSVDSGEVAMARIGAWRRGYFSVTTRGGEFDRRACVRSDATPLIDLRVCYHQICYLSWFLTRETSLKDPWYSVHSPPISEIVKGENRKEDPLPPLSLPTSL